jgi:catechol 2,3-dioxygenase-like lactoylglutathione lyase family enzyme
VDWKSCRLSIDPEKKLKEITVLNNQVDLSDVDRMAEQTNQVKSGDQVTELERQPRLDHIAFNVKDPDTVAAWYCRYLGMKIVKKNPQPPFTHFISDADGSFMLELYANPKVPVPEYAALSHMAFHLAFMTDNMLAARDSLVAAGAKVVDDITTTPAGDQVLMMRDPWGLAIQCVKRAWPMLGFEKFRPEHFALNVPNPEAMRNWYILNLGMKSMRKGGAPTYTNFIGDNGGNMMLELFHNSDFPAANMDRINPLSLHIAFVVNDVRAIRTGLIEAGATLAEDIRVSGSGDEVLVLRDPWGVPIQFIKHAKQNLR